MKKFQIIGILLVASGLCQAEINTGLARMIYDIPLVPGMEFEREKQEIRDSSGFNTEVLRTSENREKFARQIACRSKEGVGVPAQDIIDFYDEHFAALGFRKWGAREDLSGRYQGPSLVTKGEARVRSQGHIAYHVPASGDFIVLWIEQRRDFDVGESGEKIERIQVAFSAAAKDHKFSFDMPRYAEVSDLDEHVINECFVCNFTARITYDGSDDLKGFDDGNYRFHFTVFPTQAHAIQWKDRILQDIGERSPHPNYLKDGLALPPTVVGNIVVKYKGDVGDVGNAEFKKQLLENLGVIAEEFGRRAGRDDGE